jgi:hypothetical protein
MRGSGDPEKAKSAPQSSGRFATVSKIVHRDDCGNYLYNVLYVCFEELQSGATAAPISR